VNQQYYFFYPLLSILVLFCLRFIFLLRKENNRLYSLNKELDIKLKNDIEDTLGLATSEQLVKQLRIRTNMPFILLLPIKERDYNGITIESHGINQTSCFAILHLAKAITAQNFKKNGMEPPKLPPLNDYFE